MEGSELVHANWGEKQIPHESQGLGALRARNDNFAAVAAGGAAERAHPTWRQKVSRPDDTAYRDDVLRGPAVAGLPEASHGAPMAASTPLELESARRRASFFVGWS